MNNFNFENQGTSTYLTYELSSEDVLDTMSLGMITNNKIVGLANTLFTQMDDKKYIKYNVSSKVSVKQFFSGAVTKKRLVSVFKGIVDALLSAEDYMLDEKSILLDLDYIFADVSSYETVLICLPIQDFGEKHDLKQFFKEIMFSTQFDQGENGDYIGRIINYMNSTSMFSLLEFKEILDKLDNTFVAKAKNTNNRNNTNSQAFSQVKTVKVELNNQDDSSNVTQVDKPSNASVKAVPAYSVPNKQGNNNNASSENGLKPGEKPMTLFRLLTHYSKENSELYKAQKAARKELEKNKKANAKNVKKTVKKANKKQSKQVSSNNQSFMVPGQEKAVSSGNYVSVDYKSPMEEVASVSPKQEASSVLEKPSQRPFNNVVSGQSANFGETTVLGLGVAGETTVLNASNNSSAKIIPYLLRIKNNDRIEINKPVFRIGKERSYVDYFIGDNTAISRSHANIIVRDENYYVVDTNSTNHTFINGQMIQSNDEICINHGDTIRLANEDFEFKLY